MLALFLGGAPLLSGCLATGSQRATEGTSASSFAVAGSDTHVWLTLAPDRVTLIDPMRPGVTTQNGDETVVTASGGAWQTPTGQVQIRADGDSVKLRDDAGHTQWKAKLGDKIKILQGEEQVRCEIDSREPGRLKVKTPEDQLLGQVRGGRPTEVEDAQRTRLGTTDAAPSAALAVTLCAPVPAAQRAILVAELNRRGR